MQYWTMDGNEVYILSCGIAVWEYENTGFTTVGDFKHLFERHVIHDIDSSSEHLLHQSRGHDFVTIRSDVRLNFTRVIELTLVAVRFANVINHIASADICRVL